MSQVLKRIALVEDEPDIRALTELALSAIGGFEVCSHASGAEALAHAAEFAPDLILLDVMMPGMDGPEVLRRLADIENLRATPVVFLTAKARTDEVGRLRALGAIGVVPKPYDPMTLGDELRALWDAHAAGVTQPAAA